MSIRTWSNVLKKGGCVFGIDKDEVFLLIVYGRGTRSIIQQIERKIAHGTNPRDINGASLSVIPMAEFTRIETRDGGTQVTIYYRDTEKGELNHIWFMPRNHRECEGIAREIAKATRRTFRESRKDVSLGTALTSPIIAAIFSGIFSSALYLTAKAINSGQEVIASGSRQGLKQLIIWTASILGVNGSILVSFIILAACLAWGIKNAVKRPQIFVIKFPISRKK